MCIQLSDIYHMFAFYVRPQLDNRGWQAAIHVWKMIPFHIRVMNYLQLEGTV